MWTPGAAFIREIKKTEFQTASKVRSEIPYILRLPPLLHRELGMLDGERHSFLREIEHIKDNGFVAGIHSAVTMIPPPVKRE